MGQRDRDFERGYRGEGYGGRSRYGRGRSEDRDERDLGGYERSRGREHLGEFPRGTREERDRRGGYGPRERDADAYVGRSGGGRGSESERGYDRGGEHRNPYYGGGGMFGGGMGGYTGGGYLGGGFGGSAIENESEEQRAYRRQNYNDRERYDARNYEGREGYDNRRRGGRRGDDEGFFDRVADTVSSWFGGDDEARDDHRERSHRGKGPRGYTRSDDRIREDLNDDLTYHVGLDASDVEVEVTGGEVVLTGNVRSRYEKRLAEDIAEDVRGVSHVENRIRVQQQDQWGNTGEYTHTGTGGAMTAGTGGGTESPGMAASAEETGSIGTGRGRSAGGNT